MLLDLPRVDYNDKKKVKKSDLDLVRKKNQEIGNGEGKKGMTLAEMKEKK